MNSGRRCVYPCRRCHEKRNSMFGTHAHRCRPQLPDRPYRLGCGDASCAVQRHPNPILCVERGNDGCRVVPVEWLFKLYSQRTNLLFYFRIDRLLGKGRCS